MFLFENFGVERVHCSWPPFQTKASFLFLFNKKNTLMFHNYFVILEIGLGVCLIFRLPSIIKLNLSSVYNLYNTI